jgi:hypothetical protein
MLPHHHQNILGIDRFTFTGQDLFDHPAVW